MPPRFELEVTGGWLVVGWFGGVLHYSFRPSPLWRGDPPWASLPLEQPEGPSSFDFFEPSFVSTPAWPGTVESR